MNAEIDACLKSLGLDERCVVDEVLKDSAAERTELVHERGAVAGGRFVRKVIDVGSGMGAAYGLLWDAQQAGRRFAHLPQLVEYGSDGGTMVVVMEYIDGETLEQFVRRLGPSIELATEVFPLLCQAVCDLHEGFSPPIVHRDLKPSNVMMRRSHYLPGVSDGAVIIDLGIARSYREGADKDTRQLGTRDFAPPEQFGFGQTDVRSDVYALGLLLYFLLTSVVPSDSARNSGFYHPMVPEPFREVIACACSFDPAGRFGSVADMERAFRLACEGELPQWSEVQAAPGMPQSPYDDGPFPEVAGVPSGSGGVSAPQQARGPVPDKHGCMFVLGVAWNISLIIMVLFCAFGVVAVVPDEIAEGTTMVEVLQYFAVFLLFMCPLVFLLRARNVERALLPDRKPLGLGKELLLFVGCQVVLFVFLFLTISGE